jgi:hypothetical protein
VKKTSDASMPQGFAVIFVVERIYAFHIWHNFYRTIGLWALPVTVQVATHWPTRKKNRQICSMINSDAWRIQIFPGTRPSNISQQWSLQHQTYTPNGCLQCIVPQKTLFETVTLIDFSLFFYHILQHTPCKHVQCTILFFVRSHCAVAKNINKAGYIPPGI